MADSKEDECGVIPDALDGDWGAIKPENWVLRLEVYNKGLAADTFGSAPCKDAMEGNYITDNTNFEG